MTDASPRRVTLWSGVESDLAVWAYVSADGDLHIDGQDLDPPMPVDEYEYFLTVPAAQVPIVCAALGDANGDPLALLQQHGEMIVRMGEQRWLRSIGIEPGFASWS